MEKDRGFKIMAVIALLVAVTGLSIAYAAYSSTLKINGSGVVSKTQWDVHFANLGQVKLVGKAANTTPPTLDTTTISGFKATLNAPGDSVAYTFDVTNAGTLPANLSTYSLGTLSCAPAGSSGASQEEATAICKDLTYTLTYTDGGTVAQGNTLQNGETKNMTLKIEWKQNSTAQTKGNIDVTIGETTLTYTQA